MFIFSNQAQLWPEGGTATLVAGTGQGNFNRLGQVPTLEGFTLCEVELSFNDGRFGGSNVVVNFFGPCP